MSTNSDNQLVFALDGVTVQHAGELLFDSTVTSGHRFACRDTYIRCLEDFAFTLVYAGRFAVRGSMPKVGLESPGRLLTERYGEWFFDLDKCNAVYPKDLIGVPEHRETIQASFIALTKVFDISKIYWQQFYRREYASYVACHLPFADDTAFCEILFDDSCDPNAYVYPSTHKYLVDQELTDKISTEHFVDPLSKYIIKCFPDNLISTPAIREFVRRSALTHIAMDLAYTISGTDIPGFVRAPHVTRSSISEVGPISKSGILRRRLEKILVRHALAEAVSKATDRREVSDCLIELSELKKYSNVRRMIATITKLNETLPEPQKAAQYCKILEEIEKAAAGGLLDNAQLSVNALGIPSVSLNGGIVSSIAEYFSPQRRIFRKISPVAPGEYYSRLDRLFPELLLTKPT